MKLVEKRKLKKRVVINEIGLFIQAVLIFCIIAVAIVCLFEDSFVLLLESLLALALFTMAYNNQKTFKRKLFTIPYIIGGLLCLIYVVQTFIGMF